MSDQNESRDAAHESAEGGADGATLAKTDTPRSAGDEALRPRYLPRVDVLETPDAFRLTADVPGATEDGLDLTVEKDVLTLWAKVPDRPLAGRDRDRLLNRGAGYPEGDWHRTFRLGEQVDREAVEAELSRGVLTVTLPKAKEQQRRTINVKAAA